MNPHLIVITVSPQTPPFHSTCMPLTVHLWPPVAPEHDASLFHVIQTCFSISETNGGHVSILRERGTSREKSYWETSLFAPGIGINPTVSVINDFMWHTRTDISLFQDFPQLPLINSNHFFSQVMLFYLHEWCITWKLIVKNKGTIGNVIKAKIRSRNKNGLPFRQLGLYSFQRHRQDRCLLVSKWYLCLFRSRSGKMQVKLPSHVLSSGYNWINFRSSAFKVFQKCIETQPLLVLKGLWWHFFAFRFFKSYIKVKRPEYRNYYRWRSKVYWKSVWSNSWWLGILGDAGV